MPERVSSKSAAPSNPKPEKTGDTQPGAPAGRRRGRYSSDSMLARRQRMLNVVKEMIADGGPENFTVRELSQRAKVSVTTIYATYGDKESLLAAAIADYYRQLPLAKARAPETLDEVLIGAEEARAAAVANRPYARQYADLFFSSTVDPRVYAAICNTACESGGQFHWLQSVFRKGDILPGLPMKQVRTLLANERLCVLHDWIQGRTGDKDYRSWARRSFLIFARSITCGETWSEIDTELRRSLKNPVASMKNPRGAKAV